MIWDALLSILFSKDNNFDYLFQPTLSHAKSPNTTESTPYEHTTHGVGRYGHGRKPINIVIQDFTPKGGSCLTWAGVHYKTFDGKIYR